MDAVTLDMSASSVSKLREELLRRRDVDQEARAAVRRGEPDALARTMRVDNENAVWLGEVLEVFGWPVRSMVGDEGAHAAWMLAQHADRDPVLQRRCLALLKEAVAAGDAAPWHLAYLTDRVLLARGEKQIYGTQITARDGRLVPCRLRDAETVNERRASVGLEGLDNYLNEMLDRYGPPSPAPVICPNCRALMDAWLPEPGGQLTVECGSCHRSFTLHPVLPRI